MSDTPRTQKAYALSLDDTGAVTRMEPIWDEMQALEHQLNETNKKLEETEIARWNLAGLYQAAIQSHAATRKQLETITQMKEQNEELLQAALKLVESIKPYSLSEEERALIEVIEQHRPHQIQAIQTTMNKEQMRFQAAAMAMQGLSSNYQWGVNRMKSLKPDENLEAAIAGDSIELADALLSALYPTGKDKHGYCDPCTGADMEDGPGEMLASITPK